MCHFRVTLRLQTKAGQGSDGTLTLALDQERSLTVNGIVLRDEGAWISGPSGNTARQDAIEALAAFGGDIDRRTARMLLSMWTRRSELTPEDFSAVLNSYPKTCNG